MHHDKKGEFLGWYIEIFIFSGNNCIISSIFTVFTDFLGFTILKVTNMGKVCVNQIFFKWNVIQV